jgi:hypothetical protein
VRTSHGPQSDQSDRGPPGRSSGHTQSPVARTVIFRDSKSLSKKL